MDANKKKKLRTVLIYVTVPLLIIGIVFYFASSSMQSEKTQYYQIIAKFEKGNITEYSLNLSSGALEYKEKDSDAVKNYTVPNVSIFIDDVHPLVSEHNRANPETPIKYDYERGGENSWLLNIMPTIILMVVLGVVMFIMVRRMGQSFNNETNKTLSFGKARIKNAKDEKRKAKFEDVAGR